MESIQSLHHRGEMDIFTEDGGHQNRGWMFGESLIVSHASGHMKNWVENNL